MDNAYISLNLSKLFGAMEMDSEDSSGNKIKGVFIPLYDNNIRKYKNGLYLQLFVERMMTYNSYGSTHSLKLYLSKKYREKLEEQGFFFAPQIGFMKPTHKITPEQHWVELHKENYKNDKVYIKPINTDK